MKYLNRLACDECRAFRGWIDRQWVDTNHLHLYSLRVDEMPAVVLEYGRGLLPSESVECMVLRTMHSRVEFIIQLDLAPPGRETVVARMSATEEVFRSAYPESEIWRAVLISAVAQAGNLPRVQV